MSRLSQIRALFQGGSKMQRQQIRHYFRELDRAEMYAPPFTADQFIAAITQNKKLSAVRGRIK